MLETHEHIAPYGDETKDIVTTYCDVMEISYIIVILVVRVDLVVINDHAQDLTAAQWLSSCQLESSLLLNHQEVESFSQDRFQCGSELYIKSFKRFSTFVFIEIWIPFDLCYSFPR